MSQELLSGTLLDERYALSLDDLCRACALETTQIVELVEEGILRPTGREQTSWRFTTVSIEYVRRTTRLQHDLGLNLPGAALALQLLDEIGRLRTKLEVLERR